MFDSVRNNKKIVQIFLALITLPFAFFGIDSYIKNAGAGSDVASVGDTKITAPQFEQALRERQEQMRQALGPNFKAEMMNTREARLAVLNSLIDQRLLLVEASKNRLYTSDEALREVIRRIPAMQENGKFSMERYESILRSQGKSQPQFEAMLRQDLIMQQLIGAVGDSAFVSNAQAEEMLRIQSEERQFAEYRISPEQFTDKVKIEADAVQKFYDENTSRFLVPERAKAEYVVLSLDVLQAQTTVDENEVKAWYESHKDRYAQPEERRASHILIAINADTDKAKAKAKAEEVLAEVRKAPGKFAELAKQYSQDPGSAAKGGDLGFFGRGMMVKTFEDVVFKQKEGDISDLVESEFGYHIIKVTGIKPEKIRPLNDVRPEVEGELKRQAASRKFAEAADAFTNMVYEQSESLQPVADKFKLKIERSDWVPKNPDQAAMAALGPLGNEKVLNALFSDDAVKNKRNTEAIEIAPNTLLAARIVEHVPATTKSFDSVRSDIERFLRSREAGAMAKTAGEEKLAELKKGSSDTLSWSAARSVSRMQSRQLPPAAVQAIFKADVEKLPAYVGAAVGNDYMIYKVVKINALDKIDPEKRKGLQAEYAAILGQQDLAAYLAGLRARYKVDINYSMVETKER